MMQTKNEKLPVHGMIFDLDGTLIKSVVDFPKMKQRMIEYINNHAISNTRYTINQTTNEIIYDLNKQMIDRGISESDRDGILSTISRILTEVEFENLEKVELLPGVKELITIWWETGIKMGILTRASRKYTVASLERTGIKKYFNVILTRDEFSLLKAKPHPYALNYIIRELNVPPENIIFIGDHKIDYMCAKEANIRFIGILSGSFDRSKFNELGCELLVENFNELSELVRDFNNGY